MEKDQLISMIHFLVKREDERAQENQELKDMVKDLRDTHKQDVKTQTNLLKSIDKLTNQVADLTTQNRMISERIAELAPVANARLLVAWLVQELPKKKVLFKHVRQN